MGDSFSLTAVLRLREAEEEQAEFRLQQAARQLQELRDALTKARADRILQSQSLNAAAQNGISGGELSWLQTCLAAADRNIDQLQRTQQRAEAFFLQQQRAYQQAHQLREILSNLREHHRDAELLDENRRDRQRADELYVLRKRMDGD
jgi:flagellar export protein FliJ